MRARRLGASDLEVTPVALGAWALGGLMWGGCDAGDAVAAVHAALDAGVNWIDTAPAYGCGRSEELVGRALAERSDRPLLATKCGLRWDREDGDLRFDVAAPGGGRARIFYNLRPDSLREECEASLRRLGVETVDLYQVHWPYPKHPFDDAWEELVRLRDEGKVRALGFCNAGDADLDRAHAIAGLAAAQPSYSLLDRRAEADVLPWCRAHDVGVVAYSPMARGLLTGAAGPERRFDATDHRAAHPSFEDDTRRGVLAALDAAQPIARDHGVSLANLAVAWVLARPGVTAALVGARNARQATENARAGSVRLAEDEAERLAQLFESIRWAAAPKPS